MSDCLLPFYGKSDESILINIATEIDRIMQKDFYEKSVKEGWVLWDKICNKLNSTRAKPHWKLVLDINLIVAK